MLRLRWRRRAQLGRRGADRRAHARVGAAAADVGDRGVDLGIARRRGSSPAAPRPPSACRSGSSRTAAPGARSRPAAADAARSALPSASIVRRALPRTDSSGVTHERTALPSTCTVQAPQAATPQPNLVPVRPSRSRSAHSSGICGSASSSGRARDAPLTTISTPLLAGAADCARALRIRPAMLRPAQPPAGSARPSHACSDRSRGRTATVRPSALRHRRRTTVLYGLLDASGSCSQAARRRLPPASSTAATCRAPSSAFAAAEDLGGGLRAVYPARVVLRASTPARPAATAATRFWGRDANVGLSGAFGTHRARPQRLAALPDDDHLQSVRRIVRLLAEHPPVLRRRDGRRPQLEQLGRLHQQRARSAARAPRRQRPREHAAACRTTATTSASACPISRARSRGAVAWETVQNSALSVPAGLRPADRRPGERRPTTSSWSASTASSAGSRPTRPSTAKHVLSASSAPRCRSAAA